MAATPLDADARWALVEAIHATDVRLVAYVTGGGIASITDLLTVPDASRTVLDVRVPYSVTALSELIGSAGRDGDDVVGAVSATTAATMATRAHEAASRLDTAATVIGVSCTAALVTARERRGDDRAHIGICDGFDVTTSTIGPDEFTSAMTRQEQDRIVSDHLLVAMARACGVMPADGLL